MNPGTNPGPIRMHPAYRHGSMTPWGDEKLAALYGREIPDDHTGEALEMSTIPSLNSVDDSGMPLSQLIGDAPEAMVGDFAGKPFPLLLKLLSSGDSLSVQVHPDDAYAIRNEHKLGKTEAWVILYAEPGASILYGLRDGITKEMLSKALTGGEDIELMIDRIPVHPGEVYYMPAGMVHAIGGGILLYEIQQSSDVTYRLWDFNRTNAAGEKRPLHIRQALDVIDPSLSGLRTKLPEGLSGQVVQVLDVPAFTIQCAFAAPQCAIAPEPSRFRVLTALEPADLVWEMGSLELNPGDTVFIPASCGELTLKGSGRALISVPGYVS